MKLRTWALVLLGTPAMAQTLTLADESAQLACAADPEREYVEVLLPAKLRAAAAYAERATLWTDVQVLARTLRVLGSS